jgi:hypothetical protein
MDVAVALDIDVVAAAPSMTASVIRNSVPSMYPVVDDCRIFINTKVITPKIDAHTAVDQNDDPLEDELPPLSVLRTNRGRAMVL